MNYYTYNESKEYLNKFNIKSSFQFYTMVREGSFNNLLNKRPYEYFRVKKRNDWVSWEDFLSFSIDFEKENKYLKFNEAKDYVRKLGINSQKEWILWCKGRDLSVLKIPTNPNVIYKNSGWISFSDWIGNTSYKSVKNIKYLRYLECKDYIKLNFPEIKNRVVWTGFDKSKLPIFVPKRPDYFYKKSNDWINWESFLDSDISPRSKSKIFLGFSEAKEYITSLNFKDQYDFYKFIEDNNINFIPKRPDYVYKKDWIGYIDFLGCESNKKSIGERLVKSFLDEFNIKYTREKKFETCKSIKELPFDFYLPNYKICIEYDGELHYKSVEHMGGDKQLTRQKKHDRIKDKWCLENNIKLIRISYKKKNKIFKILSLEIN
jgi:very-short-patch-repair endonuclease